MISILEITQPATADEGRRCFELAGDDDLLRLDVLYEEDVSLADDAPSVQVTGNIPDNYKLGMALLTLAHRLLNTVGSHLPKA